MSKELGDFQTPSALVADVLKCLNVSGQRWTRVLEPTCGSGNFISGLLALPVPPREIQAIEFDLAYFKTAKRIAEQTSSTRIIVQQAKVFDLDLQQNLSWSESGRLLV
ncbi:SAM-dependent methyltransferase, partial [Fischerella thermalis WC217]